MCTENHFNSAKTQDMEAHTIMEEREELMVAPGGGEPTLRSAHFLKPSDSPKPQNHSTPFPLSSNSIFHPESKGLKVSYPGWRMIRESTQKGWENWVEKLQPLYGETWKQAGIFDAIMASKSKILRRKNSFKLMMKLAENWSSESNSFVFSWGEATVTLEDIHVLGGLPVLGQSVRSLAKSQEILHFEEQLMMAFKKIARDTCQPPRGSTWFDYFNGGGGEDLEHEGFLVLWLSRYVFPNKNDEIISRDVFLVAANLSRGIPTALAPAVLAGIYRDLGTLRKASLIGSNGVELSLCSPLGLVQVWVWERFLKLSPVPKSIGLGEPRISQWNEVEPLCLEAGEIAEMFDSSGDYFQWRPYVRMMTNWDPKMLYSNEVERFVLAGPEIHSEAIQILVRFWRDSELVGLDCVEQYLPHRVAMQFGFDQDVPEPVERLGYDSADSAWRHFNRPCVDARIYIPARMFESDITRRYEEAWKTRALGNQEGMDIDPNQTFGNEELMEVPPSVDDQLIKPVEMENLGAEDRSGAEKVVIPAREEKSKTSGDDVVKHTSMPGSSKRTGFDDELIRPVEMEILGDAGDRTGTEKVMISVHEEGSKTPVEHDAVNQNYMPLPSKRSGGSYDIEEVKDMVTNLEKLWATVKAKRGESAAKKMKRI